MLLGILSRLRFDGCKNFVFLVKLNGWCLALGCLKQVSESSKSELVVGLSLILYVYKIAIRD